MEAPNAKEIVNNLTRQEKKVLAYVTDDLTNKEISKTLNIAECTVKKHRENIFKKADAKGVTEIRKFIRVIKPYLG
jgi:FixJ family two-component response regulator